MVNKLTIIRGLYPLLTKPKMSMHLAAFSKELQEPHPTVRLWLGELEEEGILIKEARGRLSFYRLNLNHPMLIDYLVLAEKARLIEMCTSSLILSEAVSQFHSVIEWNMCVIFGSGVASIEKAKDVDVLAIGSDISKEIKSFERKIGKSLHVISLPNLSGVSAALKSEIEKKHFCITGTEQFVRWILW